mmetsp:Transcript_1558/g.2075  ORF Transcript_1558/g.2075 Transcript_1558/m.2075 type:complete len:292 (+) Transcript_1558:66-941(+)|eukprot:CAMPEP_0197293798 /NCGR_PEP_ID=MMETSP0890-20130614/29939_1 /TAXON_ID=44058 ORGANISM="Aureoumbra lagunensis, Strain CCMP1510" /NCGR_SAMPLE_ID=MMETSP0890 /ASSEMBLY_ACC=CAM_ASM_000533 /LENGTH=291 /DNA_ID=CAMNT_0042768817 /DNA_START=27 /DNA_END=902 /DNA_ORIENTATION=-
MGDDPKKVYIGGLDESIPEEEIRRQVEKFGTIDTIWLAKNPPGFCFVYFTDERDAADCVKAIDDTLFCGSKIRAQIARTKKERLSSSSKIGIGGYRIRIENIAHDLDWRFFKDFFRDGLNTQVTYANVEGDYAIVEFNTEDDRERAIDKYDRTEIRGNSVTITKIEGSSAEYFKSRGGYKAPSRGRSPSGRYDSRYDSDYRGRRYDDYRDHRDYDSRRPRSRSRSPQSSRRYDDRRHRHEYSYDDRRDNKRRNGYSDHRDYDRARSSSPPRDRVRPSSSRRDSESYYDRRR